MSETPAELHQLMIDILFDEYPDGYALDDITKIADRVWGWMERNYDTPSLALLSRLEKLERVVAVGREYRACAKTNFEWDEDRDGELPDVGIDLERQCGELFDAALDEEVPDEAR